MVTLLQAVSPSPDVFTGVTIATRKSGSLLLIANFKQSSIDVYNSSFSWVRRFSDTTLTQLGFAPFNVLAVDRQVYVTFAQQDDLATNPVLGAGLG